MVLSLELALTVAKMEAYCLGASPDPPPLFTSELRLVHLFLTLMYGDQYVQERR